MRWLPEEVDRTRRETHRAMRTWCNRFRLKRWHPGFLSGAWSSRKTGFHFSGPCSVLEQLFELEMDAFAKRGMMTLTGGKQGARFLRALGLDPPFLGAGHQHRGVEDFRLRS